MKRIYLLFFLFAGSVYLYSQTVDGKFVVSINNGVTYQVQVWIKIESGTYNLGNASIQFTYNNSALSYSSSPGEGTDYSFINFQGGDYTSTISRPVDGTVSINIAYTGSGGGTTVPTSYIEVAVITMGTTNSSGNSNLVWSIRELYSPGSSTVWGLGSWPNEDTHPLPVELSSFSASVNANNVTLNWKTATEVNNNGFEVERAAVNPQSEIQNQQFEKIGFVEGHGNSNSPKEYTFTDKYVTGGTKFSYRLKQIDNDGRYDFSKEVEIEVLPKTYALYQNYPNPFNPSTTINYQLSKPGKVLLKVYDILGKEVAILVNEYEEAGNYSVKFSAENGTSPNVNSVSLPSGIYIYELTVNNYRARNKMMLVK